MSAPKGNEFWKLRSKHGRDKIFSTPNILWDAACEYFEWCESNPLEEVDFRGKDAVEIVLPRMRAFTLHGLCIFLDVHTKYFNDFEYGLKDKKDKKSKDFSNVLTRIREIIYNQKFTGAAAGFLNPNIIARDLGLQDKKELDHTTKGESFAPAIIIKQHNGNV